MQQSLQRLQTVVDPQMCGVAGFGAMQIMLKPMMFIILSTFMGGRRYKTQMWAHLIERECDDGFALYLKGSDGGYQSMTSPMTLCAFDLPCPVTALCRLVMLWRQQLILLRWVCGATAGTRVLDAGGAMWADEQML